MNYRIVHVFDLVCCRFMLSPIPNIKNTLDMKVKAADAKIKTIEVG